MDWSAIYDNSGEEEGRWEDHGETRSSRNAHRLLHRKASISLGHDARLVGAAAAIEDAAIAAIVTPPASSARRRGAGGSVSIASTPVDGTDEDDTPQYSPLVAYAFTVNYILGVGSLGIPFAFYRAGLLMGNVLIAVVTFISYVTVMWVGETVARAREALRVQRKSARSEHSALLMDADILLFDDFPEVTQLCATFLGRTGAAMYQISLLGLMYGGLVGYSQVFVNSFLSQVTHIGGWALSSAHAAIVFACIVVPLSCSDLTEQIHVQLAMSVVRFAALAIMIFSALYAIFTDPVDSGASADVKASSPPYISAFSLVNLGGFGVMFSTGVFSQLFQHSVPGLLAPLGAKNQEKAGHIFGGTLVTTMLFYMTLGSVCSLYFGTKVSSSVNLNWADFSWGFEEDNSATDATAPTVTPWWARALSMLVVIFPALDTLSVFPLISVTLGDNMAASIPHAWRGSHSARAWWKLACRFVASVPPLLIAVFVSDLSLTLQLSGVAGVYVAFFAPALLQLRARRAFPAATVYSGRFSSEAFVYAVLVFGALAFVVLVAQLVQQMLVS